MLSERKQEQVLKLLIASVVVVIVNQLTAKYPVRFDLTEERRYSIADASRHLLSHLDDVVYVEVYLDGDMPNGFKRLRKAIEETLQDFQYYAGANIEYKFVDPSAAKSRKARNEFYQSIIKKGLLASNVNYTENGKQTQKLIFPGAIVSYYGREKSVILLKGNKGAGAEEQLNQSVEGLEYELANAIRILASDQRKRIGIIRGHGEPDSLQLAGLNAALRDKYDVYNVHLPTRTQPLNSCDVLIAAKPKYGFSEAEKYKLDQYIMQGGKAMFFLDALHVNMDSAMNGEGTVALPYELNLSDMLFSYGLRINQNYVLSLDCGDFPVVAGNMGEQAQVKLLPWPFFPQINTFAQHPIVKNMDMLITKFAANIDTVKAAGIKKTPLLFTSQYSRVLSAPVRIALNDLQESFDHNKFTTGSQPIAYLMEGKFNSMFKNQVLPLGVKQSEFKDTAEETAIIVCADGDMIKNDFNPNSKAPLQLGLDPYSRKTYANQDFVLNSLEYLLNDDGIITAKAKEIKLRPLDKVKTAEEKLKWQIINLALPVVLLTFYGTGRFYYRKRKYARCSPSST